MSFPTENVEAGHIVRVTGLPHSPSNVGKCETRKKRMSRELRNGITRNLMGINVRLLTLKRGAKAGKRIPKEIASAQWLVEKSVKTMDRFACKFSFRDET